MKACQGLLICLLSMATAFYLPGVSPRDYQDFEELDVKVNKLDSVHTQLNYKYYDLPFCRPEIITDAVENLGEVLGGDVIESSPFKVSMKMPSQCKILCAKQHTAEELQLLSQRIEDDYRVNLILDNMPVATKYYVQLNKGNNNIDTAKDEAKSAIDYAGNDIRYEKGFSIGFVGSTDLENTYENVKYLNNHVTLNILYHESEAFEGTRIVGFEASPLSVKHIRDPDSEDLLKTCGVKGKKITSTTHQDVTGRGQEIIYTYDVTWEKSETRWASRWDVYLKMTNPSIHWFSIINSIMIVLFLTGMVAMVMLQTLLQDFRRYNQIDIEEDDQDDTGWKLIHGEVFRPPNNGGLLSICVGTGVQICGMSGLTLVFALFGFLSPSNRGGLMTALLMLFVFMGCMAGFTSSIFASLWKIPNLKSNTLKTALFFPGVMFTCFFGMNIAIWQTGSSGAVPFGTLVALLVLWLGCSLPLVYAGAYAADQLPDVKAPLRVNNIPRQIPPITTWYSQPTTIIMLGGILPFAAVFIEIFFILSSVWHHQFYYVFGFLFAVFMILCLTCAEIAVVVCYLTLCSEDYQWHWRAFLTPSSSALYLFLYSILYYFTKIDIAPGVPTFLFFAYMFLASFAFFLLTGTIGFLSCNLFVVKIYSSIKID